MKPPRTFKLARLYHKYLSNTKLGDSFSVESLADRLEALGFIVRLQDRYSETELFKPYKAREALNKLLMGE